MAANDTPDPDKIRWHKVGDPTKGGVSPLGEYEVTDVITFRRPDGSREIVPAPSLAGGHIYRACVKHNRRLLGLGEAYRASARSEPGPTRRRHRAWQDAQVCPKCHTTHPADGDCW